MADIKNDFLENIDEKTFESFIDKSKILMIEPIDNGIIFKIPLSKFFTEKLGTSLFNINSDVNVNFDIAFFDDDSIEFNFRTNNSKLSNPEKEKIIYEFPEKFKNYINNCINNKYPGMDIKTCYMTYPQPEKIFNTSEDLRNILNNNYFTETKNDNKILYYYGIKDMEINDREAEIILKLLKQEKCTVYADSENKIYLLESTSCKGKPVSTSELIDLMLNRALSHASEGKNSITEDEMKLLKDINESFKEYEKCNKAYTNPGMILKDLSLESEIKEVPELFCKLLKEKIKEFPEKKINILAYEIYKDWEKNKPYFKPALNEFLTEQGCNSKIGMEKFFQKVINNKVFENKKNRYKTFYEIER